MDKKTRTLFLVTSVLCVSLILVSLGPLFGYENYLLMLGLCIVLVSIAFVLYIPTRMELSKQYFREKIEELPPEKLEKMREKNPEFIRELEETLKDEEQKQKYKPLEPR